MERLDLTADHAFDYLRRTSSHTNLNVVDIGAEIAGTRRLIATD